MPKINYYSDLGVTNVCSNSAFNACQYSAPKYSYKYCFSYNIVFDGMFNIETGNMVPVSVSEQDLYNPYYKPDLMAGPNSTCFAPQGSGTLEGMMYCAVRP